jgi:MtN3 and saliva related transmembrane protein
MAWQDIFGFIAGTLTTIALVPQVWRLFKLKSAQEISLPFTLMFLFGGIFWLTYGIMLAQLPLIFANAISLVLVSLMLFAKLKWGRTPTNAKHT